MTVIVEARRSVHVGSAAHLVEEDREVAWAQEHMIKDADVRWIVGNYVEADNANSNGHIFPLSDLVTAERSIAHKPLNVLHRPHQIVGAFVASSLIDPRATDAGLAMCADCGACYPDNLDVCPTCGSKNKVPEVAPGSPGEMDGLTSNPKVQALSVFWKYYFPDLYDVVEAAHKEGQLYYSMECVPETVGCIEEGCKGVFAYAGRNDPSYCAHLNAPGGRKVLNKPHFTAGALIIPPVRPGWKHADITELSKLIESELALAERTYDQIALEMPHLEPKEWENLMGWVLAAAAQ